MSLSSSSDYPAGGPQMNWKGHRMALFRTVVEEPYAKCEACGLKVTAEEALEGAGTVDPCPETEEGRRLLAEAEREAHPLLSVITAPCIATPPDWEGTDAEAVGLAVAGAVADLQRQRDQAQAVLQQSLDLLAALVHATPETSWAGSNIALDKARDFLREQLSTPGTEQ